MKRYYNIIALLIILFGSIACEDLKFGEDFLEKPVSDELSVDSVFAQKAYADQALNQVYKSLPDFMPTLGGYNPEGFILDVFSDIGYTERLSWVTGAVTASSGRHCFPYQISHKEILGDPTFGIRKAHIYLENVDKVPDMSAEEKKIRKAEVKVIIAMHYIQMLRFFGGVPLIDHAYTAEEDFNLPRMTVEETVDSTVLLLDEAAKDLPWTTTNEEFGHMTAAVAKALKFRLLHFAASPLFNSTQPYMAGEAADLKLTWYGDFQQERWETAMKAGIEFLELNNQNGNYYQIENSGDPQEDYVKGYFVKGSHEAIMVSFRWAIYLRWYKPFRMYEGGYGAPRGNYADMFQWKDGTDFDWNNPVHAANPFFDDNGNPTRDARLYETLLVNRDKWQGRKSEVYNGGREGYGSGSKVGKKTQYGYGFRKFVRDKSNEVHNKPYSCPLIRIPEIYLGMAEVMNQLGKATVKDQQGRDAYDYLNIVRNRAGLPDVTSNDVSPGEDLWQFLMDERAREFGQEEVRYFDIVRNKRGDWVSRPMEMLETTIAGQSPLKFNYNVSVRDDIKYLWKDNWYLLPFPMSEVNKKYGLVQNPGW
ncbi:RagB/SusD family nutrient uptake outer membrane protein [Puteibacter caeruleilacunae]|nr:RagB/SusD family nutrient uptake outer membrane protein [Puteibacter caeruleilacunae]